MSFDVQKMLNDAACQADSVNTEILDDIVSNIKQCMVARCGVRPDFLDPHAQVTKEEAQEFIFLEAQIRSFVEQTYGTDSDRPELAARAFGGDMHALDEALELLTEAFLSRFAFQEEDLFEQFIPMLKACGITMNSDIVRRLNKQLKADYTEHRRINHRMMFGPVFDYVTDQKTRKPYMKYLEKLAAEAFQVATGPDWEPPEYDDGPV